MILNQLSTETEPPSLCHQAWSSRWTVGSKAFATDGVMARWPAQVHGYSPGPLEGVWLRLFRKCRGYLLITAENNLEAFTDKNRLKILREDVLKKQRSSFNDACQECKNANESVEKPFQNFMSHAVSNIFVMQNTTSLLITKI